MYGDYTLHIEDYVLMALVVLVPLITLLVVAYRNSRPKAVDHTRHTPNPTTVTLLPTVAVYDWADPSEMMDYDEFVALIVECPADPYTNTMSEED